MTLNQGRNMSSWQQSRPRFKEMDSRFDGKCADCGAEFPKGTRIIWDRQEKKATHKTCPSKADPVKEAAVKTKVGSYRELLVGLKAEVDGLMSSLNALTNKAAKVSGAIGALLKDAKQAEERAASQAEVDQEGAAQFSQPKVETAVPMVRTPPPDNARDRLRERAAALSQAAKKEQPKGDTEGMKPTAFGAPTAKPDGQRRIRNPFAPPEAHPPSDDNDKPDVKKSNRFAKLEVD